jgi:hypothetical protein
MIFIRPARFGAKGEIMSPQLREKRRETGQGVADRLLATEIGIDNALALAAALSGLLPEARISAQLAAEVGHEAFERVSEALQHLVQARTAIVKAHQNLAQVQITIGLEAFAFGGSYGKPTTGLLHVVEQQAA